MRQRGMRRVIAMAIAIVVIGFALALGYRYWFEPTYNFVETDDAQVTGNLTRVAAPAGGEINRVFFNVGDTVHKDDVVATLKIVASVPTASAGPVVGRLLTRVTSPLDGRVAARSVSAGDTVAPGQPLLTLTDVQNVWVVANVEEGRVPQLAPGQRADVSVAGLNQTFTGKVAQIGSATTEVTNPAVGGLTASSDSAKKVPVRIQVDWQSAQPLPGLTADVTIYIKGE